MGLGTLRSFVVEQKLMGRDREALLAILDRAVASVPQAEILWVRTPTLSNRMSSDSSLCSSWQRKNLGWQMM